MLNFAVGSPTVMDGRTCLVVRKEPGACALFGPYQYLQPGRYAVEFDVAAAADEVLPAHAVCGSVDVTADFGRDTIVRAPVRAAQLRAGGAPIRVMFDVRTPRRFEYRVFTSGTTALVVADAPRVVKVEPGEDVDAKLARERFPDPGPVDRPDFFNTHLGFFRDVHARGARVEIRCGTPVVTIEGVAFHARMPDDIRFVGEIFHHRAYHIVLPRDACLIDVGMNLGLVSLLLASRPRVMEVHAFEPFKATYDRAVDNLELNPALAAKITPYNVGLGAADEAMTVRVGSHGDSGSNSIYGPPDGTPTRIEVRNAATVLAPIIERAEAQGRDVVMKLDCEGAEFAIFDVLAAAGLLARLSAVMVEWHTVTDDRAQQDLIEPLLGQGFIVFDLTSGHGNGFFYGVRSGAR